MTPVATRRPRRTPVLAAAGAAAALLLVAACGGGDGSGSDRRGTAETTPATDPDDWIARTDDDAVFTVDCTFSHRAPDDPIVHPGDPGASHSHEFFGSSATDASSTGASLLGTPTTCEDPEDTAAYWVPTLSVRGLPVEPTFLRAYYRATPGVDVREVTPPPLGLAMLSGDPAAVGGGDHGHDLGGHDDGNHDDGNHDLENHDDGNHDDGNHDDGGHDDGGPGPSTTSGPGADERSAITSGGGWGCGLRPRRLHATPPTDCTEVSPLALQLRFPDCWDGEHLDSADHRSHVARSVDGRCPATHPVTMTELQVTITWPVTGEDGAEVALASGDLAGSHGDFLNGWDPAALARHVELCVHAKANCTVG